MAASNEVGGEPELGADMPFWVHPTPRTAESFQRLDRIKALAAMGESPEGIVRKLKEAEVLQLAKPRLPRLLYTQNRARIENDLRIGETILFAMGMDTTASRREWDERDSA